MRKVYFSKENVWPVSSSFFTFGSEVGVYACLFNSFCPTLLYYPLPFVNLKTSMLELAISSVFVI